MTNLRDEIRGEFNHLANQVVNGEGNYGRLNKIVEPKVDAILALIKPILTAISDNAVLISNRHEQGSQTYKDALQIFWWCKMDKPDEPTLAVGQTWEKAPTHKCTIKFIHTSDEGVEQIVVENRGGHLVVMKPETFERYQLVKDGEA